MYCHLGGRWIGQGSVLYKYHFVAHLNTMLLWPNCCSWLCQLAHTSYEQTLFTLCKSGRVSDEIVLLIVGKRGVYTSLVANRFALLMVSKFFELHRWRGLSYYPAPRAPTPPTTPHRTPGGVRQKCWSGSQDAVSQIFIAHP